MSSNILRAAVLGAILAAAGAGTASASTNLVSHEQLIDATSDGKLFLLGDGSVLDNAAQAAVLPASTRTPVDLADRAPVSLEKTDAGALYLRTTAAPAGAAIGIDEKGASVPVATARLVRNGAAVIFGTSEATPRIIERDLATGQSTVRLMGASLLDASEDGNVVTWLRHLPSVSRPAGAALSGDPAPLEGDAVGYQLKGTAPRVVDTTHYTQRPSGQSGTCPTWVNGLRLTPYMLAVSQDGDGGRYTLMLGGYQWSDSYPFRSANYSRILETGSTLLVHSDGQVFWSWVTTDPHSGAYVTYTNAHFAQGYNTAVLTADDGTTQRIGPSYVADAIPFARGEAIAATGAELVYNRPPWEAVVGTWFTDGLPAVGESTTPWLTLPRASDPVDGPATKVDASWEICAGVPGVAADYAPITLATAGSAAGKVGVALTPIGKVPAKAVSATVSWFGIPLWSRTAKSTGSLSLPSIPAGLAGFKLTVKITLTNGTVLSEAATLRRTR